jgi:hypothetical protein
MKKLLLAGIAAQVALASTAAHAQTAIERECAKQHFQDGEVAETDEQQANYDRCVSRGRIAPTRISHGSVTPTRITVPALPSRPPLGWVYGPYTSCADPPRCSTAVVNVAVAGLNVRIEPAGQPIMSLVNGVPIIPLGREGDWLLVAADCDLTPTFAWSWTAGVPLNRCWVYFY